MFDTQASPPFRTEHQIDSIPIISRSVPFTRRLGKNRKPAGSERGVLVQHIFSAPAHRQTADPVLAAAMRQEAAIQRHDIIAIGTGQRRHLNRRAAVECDAVSAAPGVGRHQRRAVPPDAARCRHPDARAFKGHAAFHRVPERWEF